MTIQERRCPWCLNRRTARMGVELSVCFNCRHHWHGISPLEWRSRAETPTEPLALFTFGPVEAARLVVYRAAVQSGFFSDWPRQRVA